MKNITVPRVPGLSCYEIGKIAEEFIRATYPELLKKPAPFPVDAFFESRFLKGLGFDYGVQEDLPTGVEGVTDLKERVVILTPNTYEDLVKGKPRARFTVAHEIGHVMLHAKHLHSTMQNSSDSHKFYRKRTEILPYEDPEWQANHFASAVLMPTHHIQALIVEKKYAFDIATQFNVSVEAAKIRIEKLHKYIK